MNRLKQGFTIVEVLVVIAVLAILIYMLVRPYKKSKTLKVK